MQAALRNNLKNSFNTLKCDVLPYPGDVVSGAKNASIYNGNWGEMSEEFKNEIVFVVDKLLKPRNLVSKSKKGEYLTGLEFKNYVVKFLKALQSAELPKADSIYEIIVEKQINLIVSECIECYRKTSIENQELVTNEEQIPIFHEMSKSKALVMYKDKKKLGGEEHEKKFQEILEALIEKAFTEWSNQVISNKKAVNTEKVKNQLVMDEKEILELKQTQYLKTIQEKDENILKLKNDIRKEQEKLKNFQEVTKVRIEILNEQISIAETQKKIEESKRRECETLREIDGLKTKKVS